MASLSLLRSGEALKRSSALMRVALSAEKRTFEVLRKRYLSTTSPADSVWPSIAIIGGGVGGLSFANLLVRRFGAPHNRIKVFEQVTEKQLTGNAGVGFSLGSGKFIIDHLMNIPEINTITAPPLTKILHRTFEGGVLGKDIDIKESCLKSGWPVNELMPVGILRADLIRLLVSSLPKGVIQYDQKLASISSKSSKGVTVSFADGREEEFDIVVGADGIRSKTKEYVTKESKEKPVYSGTALWFGLAKLPLNPESYVNKVNAPSLGDGVLIKVLGNGGNFSCFRMGPSSTLGKDDGLLAFWVTHRSKEVLTESWDLKHSKEELLKIVAEQSGNEDTKRLVHDVVSRTERVMHLGLFYHGDIPTKWHEGRVVLLGDAPHAMLPYLGQGGNQAIEDAESLSRIIAKAVVNSNSTGESINWENVFDAYTKERYEKVSKLAQKSLLMSKLELTDNSLLTFARNKLLGFLNKKNLTAKGSISIWTSNLKDVLKLNGVDIQKGEDLEEALRKLKKTRIDN